MLQVFIVLLGILDFVITAGNKGLCSRINGKFSCNSGQCIDIKQLCDGDENCYDGSDETLAHCVDMRCKSSQFQCGYGACISFDKRCDGDEDCKDGSDEETELCSSKPPPMPPPSGGTANPEVQTNRPNKDSENQLPNLTPWSPPVRKNGKCVLPDQPLFGHYGMENCGSTCSSRPGELVEEFTLLRYSCFEHYVLSNEIPYSICESTGKWNPELPTCLKLCPALRNRTSLSFRCYYGKQINCYKPMRPGTTVEISCEQWYENVRHPLNQCKEKGDWVYSFSDCEPKCGITKRLHLPAKLLLSGGYQAEVGEHPWHVALYYDEGSTFKCGGSIISTKAILTAAHCIPTEEGGELQDFRHLRVAVGKHNRSWSIINKDEQRFKVKRIFIYEHYRGAKRDFEHDIAIIAIDGVIELRGRSLPICIVRNKFDVLRQDSVYGMVPGWGDIGNGSLSDVLNVANYTAENIFDSADCSSKLPRRHREKDRFVREDKFCVFTRNSLNLGQGDSGGGFTVVKYRGGEEGGERHYIYGIVSILLVSENNFHLSALTNVTYYIDWIYEKLLVIDKLH